MNQQVSTSQRNQNRSKLVILILLFFGSVFIAWLLINNADNWRPWGTKNNGDFVVPVRSLTNLEFQTEDGSDFTIKEMLGKWVMVYIGQQNCDKDCSTNLYNIRQTRLGQKGEHGRIERLYVMIGDSPTASLKNALLENNGMKMVKLKQNGLAELISHFSINDSLTADKARRVYLIDPLGNLMMKYEFGFDPRGLAKDLELLLKVSLIG